MFLNLEWNYTYSGNCIGNSYVGCLMPSIALASKLQRLADESKHNLRRISSFNAAFHWFNYIT